MNSSFEKIYIIPSLKKKRKNGIILKSTCHGFTILVLNIFSMNKNYSEQQDEENNFIRLESGMFKMHVRPLLLFNADE